MKGFKSFADKTIIDFEKGVTAVVGPNGSGKSNITEALRWVLGETSAKSLRGGKMPDIIFAGSENRKALNIAEVTVVLDNGDNYFQMDFTEISVTRRISRSGDSDYFINKKAARLRDIQELFMDSGLGKESFSIISQGKVEAIFNSKPEERRGIFEEAAGVLKYKTRKKEAEKKLFETEDNLNRLQDILYELEEQLEPLKEQSEVAQTYEHLKKELTTLDVALTVAEIEENKATFDAKQKEYEEIHQQYTQKNIELLEKERLLAEKRVERSSLQEQLEGLQSQFVALTEAHTTALGEKNVLAERSKYQEKNAREMEESLKNVQDEIHKVAKEIDTLATEMNDIDDELAEFEETREELEEKIEQLSKSSKEIASELRTQILSLTEQEATIQNDLKYLEEQYQVQTKNNEQKILEYEALKEKISKAKQEIAKGEENLSSKSRNVEEMLEQFNAQKQEQSKVKNEYDSAQQALFRKMNEISQVKARLKSLRELQENYQGYYQGVKAILKNRKELSGIVGTVAEILDVPKEYALAVETSLGSATQNIIVENEENAKVAIQYLSKNRLGRATFYPITTIKPRHINDVQKNSFTSLDGFIGVASELVKCEEKVRSIVDNLLGQVLIAQDLESATRIARTIRFQYRVVSLDGAVMNQGGSMTGGANKSGNRSTLLSQVKEIEELSNEAEMLMSEQVELENALKFAQSRLEEENARLEEVRNAGEALRMEEVHAKNDYDAIVMKLQSLVKNRHAFEEETKELSAFLSDYEERSQSAREDLALATAEKMRLTSELEHVEENASKQQITREETLNALHKLLAKIDVSNERLSFLTKSLQEKSTQQKSLNAQKFELTTLLKNMEDTSSSHQLSEEEIANRIEELAVRKTSLEEEIEEKKMAHSEVSSLVAQMDEELTALNKESQTLLSQQSKAEVESNRASLALDNFLEYLQEEYFMTFEAAREDSVAVSDKAQTKTQVRELKRQIENLGPVNMSAIEQYKQVAERYEFLTEQQKDLLTAKQSLFDTMDEMDIEVTKRFKETFEAIRKHFTKTFPSMFGGGRADLILCDPEDLLNTGIEIEAQPPGKKMQNLSLLSGGERALTAIALLFSIIQVRPVPFCVLDEVEAALDEANVARFGHYLAHFEDETQFIVVTHRKGTMESANVLYGVTMQESGVSKIVSVRLEDVHENGGFEAK